MSSFDKNRGFEEEFTDRLLGALRPLFASRDKMVTQFARAGGSAKTGLDIELQRKMGDLQIVDKHGKYLAQIDMKVERRSSPNIFFEVFSNGVTDPALTKLGWGMSINVDRIWYAFADIGAVAIIDLPKLRKWLDEIIESPGGPSKLRHMKYPERLQQLHHQLNRTIGRLIPFKDLPVDVWSTGYVLKDDQAQVLKRDEFLALVKTVWK